MKENWDAKLIAHLALGGVAGLLGSVIAMISPFRLAIALPLAVAGGTNIALARHYGQRRELGLSDALGAAADMAGDYLALVDETPGPDAAVEVVLRRFSGNEAEALTINTRSVDWYTPQFSQTNVALTGGGGSGKSINARHLVDFIVARLGLESIFGLLSTHYEQNPENPLNRWFPGVAPEDVKGIVTRQPGMTRAEVQGMNWARLQAFEALMDERMAAEATDAPFRFLVVDDYQYQFPESKIEAAGKIVQTIVDEARKYNLRLIIVLHSLKGKNNYIDSSALWSMTAIIFQSALADPNMKSLWPHDIAKRTPELADTLGAEARAAGGQWRVALCRAGSIDPGWDGAQVKLLPDRAASGITFKVEDRPWIDSVTEELLVELESKRITSFTAATKRAGLTRRHKHADGTYKDPRAQQLWEWWQSLNLEKILPEG